MAFPTKQQQIVKPVKVTERSWTHDMKRLEQQSAPKVSCQKMYPLKGLNSVVIHEATHIEHRETARHPQSVRVTRVIESDTRSTTTTANSRHDSKHKEVLFGHESPSRGDRVETWFSETSHNLRCQEDMRSEARRFFYVDAETKRALQALEEPMGQSGSDGRGGSWRKQQGERGLQWIGGWTDEGYTPR
ncbi:hypothetical protein LTR70_006030 [Exophiala xenobiotica]|uniref:Uncharacterized protein n=1 Tax=Lithohypha guttulata TaxID=1690604 RepID=A0ABR0KAU2_9EURO|nr:hypothetical protein LTR24_004778 [Lithohypha guttulata]KAK5316999.1 hypothetical protein LTR70_006030 [Exophiala xenobiotica]